VTSGDITNKMCNVIFDTTVDDVMNLRVGYASPDPCKNVSLCSISTPYADDEECNGVLRITVHSLLQSPSTSGSNVDVLVFARACNDMRFGVPQTRVWNALATAEVPFATAYEFQGGIGDNDEEGETTINLVGNGAPDRYPIQALAWGEEFASVRPMLQKFSPIYLNQIASFSGTLGPAVVFPHFWPVRKGLGSGDISVLNQLVPTNVPVFTWLSWYSAMFVGLRGSVRYKLLATDQAQYCMWPLTIKDISEADDPYVQLLDHSPNYFGLTRLSGAAGLYAVQGTSSQAGAEFLIPYYSERKFWSNRILTGGPRPSDFWMWPMRFNGLGNDGGTPPIGWVYYAGGPDIAPVRFRRVPAIKYSGP